MLSLPPEVQLDVLKSLNFTQLFSLRQANFYFCNLINKYEGELARMKFSSIDLATCCPDFSCEYTFIDPQSGVFEITLNDQLKEKWQDAIDKSIPLFFDGEGVETLYKVFIGKKAGLKIFVFKIVTYF
ncbi:unnamed protein product [Meloidogyne enterolobii]|uniref:Uncharacterized protein n=1 Tax=Meloidogyne enterolobii TaxID=390850 RepID=A0ACB0XPV7_MELEN